MGVIEADARDALGGRGGAGGGRDAGRGGGGDPAADDYAGGSMRRRCVPGDEAAWGGLRRTAAGLTEGVNASVGRKAGMRA